VASGGPAEAASRSAKDRLAAVPGYAHPLAVRKIQFSHCGAVRELWLADQTAHSNRLHRVGCLWRPDRARVSAAEHDAYGAHPSARSRLSDRGLSTFAWCLARSNR